MRDWVPPALAEVTDAVRSEAPLPSLPGCPVPPIPEAFRSPGVARVLVVDDDPDIQRLLKARLEAWGYSVEAAFSGEEGLARAAASSPDLIVLDVALSGMSGLEALEQLRSQPLDTAIILTTAFGSEDVAVQALRRGATDYLRKPFNRDELRTVVDRAVASLTLARQTEILQRQLGTELARAAQVQAELLPREYPALVGFELAARCIPAREVGGDFYDWQELAPGLLSMTVADIMGKGMPAALMMATVRAALRGVVSCSSPAAAVQMAAAALDADLAHSGSFVTLFHAQLDASAGRLRYVDAGHGYVLLRRASGEIEELEPWGLPLGVASDEVYREGCVALEPGDLVAIYSDGLVSVLPEFQADRSKLADAIASAAGASEMVERLSELATAVTPLPDDLTIVVLRRFS